jgi:hypothetical protein
MTEHFEQFAWPPAARQAGSNATTSTTWQMSSCLRLCRPAGANVAARAADQLLLQDLSNSSAADRGHSGEVAELLAKL